MDKPARKYFERIGVANESNDFGLLNDKDIFVVIPCYNEDDIDRTISSIRKSQEACNIRVQLVVVVNSHIDTPKHILEQNAKTIRHLNSIERSTNFVCHTINLSIENKKEAGAGMARKVGMDSVAHQASKQNREVIICSLDADCLVSENYFEEIKNSFSNKRCFASTIYFEHRFKEIADDEQRKGAIIYELFMRYYFHASKYYGLPHPMYTVGSCFAVTSSAYIKVGGMNKRIAGEDFYFLHALTTLGKIGNISRATVYPSARISDRVLFGTGVSIGNWTQGDRSIMEAYPLVAFEELGKFWSIIEKLYSKPLHEIEHILSSHSPAVLSFMKKNNKDLSKLLSIGKSCTSSKTFVQRVPTFFTALDQQRFLRSYKDGNPHKDLITEATQLLDLMGITSNSESIDILTQYRGIDRQI